MKKIKEAIDDSNPCDCHHSVEVAISESSVVNATATSIAAQWIKSLAGHDGSFEDVRSSPDLAQEITKQNCEVDRLTVQRTVNGWEICDFSA
jgi:hypothetical protein